MKTSMLLAVVCLLGVAGWGLGTAGGGKKDAFKLSEAEQKLLDLTNAERVKAKLPTLKANPKLFEAARAHSANMAKQNKMEHVLDGVTPMQRVKNAGYNYLYVGENIAAGEVDLEDVVKGWMNSKLHRENILNPNFTEIGLGLTLRGQEETFYTQVFGQPKKK